MAKGQASIRIERPAMDVFSYVTDPANFPRWQGEVLEAELVSEGPMGAGSHARGWASVGRALDRQFETNLANLKDLLEGGADTGA